MNRFRTLSIRAKLILIILSVSLIIILLLGGTRIAWDIHQERLTAERELSALTQLLGNRSSAALAFDDAISAAENLNSLKTLPQVTLSCLYRSDGSIIAEYRRDNKVTATCPEMAQLPNMRTQHDANRLHIASVIQQDSQPLGWIYLRSDMSLIEERLQDQIVFSGLALLAAALLAGVLAGWVQRLVSGPITAVTKIARTIEEKGDHNLRAKVSSNDEMGQLARTFNAMLDAMEIQNQQLVKAKDEQIAASALYRSLVETTSAIPWELDLASWRFVFVGHQAELVLGYPVEDWYREGFWDEHLHPDDRDASISYCHSATAQMQDHQFEYRMIAANNRCVWIHDDVQVIVEDGKAVRLQGFMFDITARKRHEEAIKNIATGVSAQTGEAFFPQLVKHLASMFDTDYAFIGLLDNNDPKLVNTYAVCAHGKIAPNLSYSLADTPCENVAGQQTCAYPEHVQELFPNDKLLADMGVDSYIGTPLFNARGEAIGLLVILDDKPMRNLEQVQEILQIFAVRAAAELERMKAEQTVRKLSLAVEQSPNAITITDPEGIIEYVNPAFSYITGYSEEETIGARPNLLKSGQTPTSLYDALWETIKAGHTWSGEIFNRKKDGNFYWSFATISPIKDNDGNITHFLSIQTDISERKAMEAELQHHREKLETLVEQRTNELSVANKELESFSYSVSHDLRAPLRSITGFSQALLEDYKHLLDEDGQDLFARIINNANRMSELIDSLLQLSRLGRKELRTQAVDFDALVSEVEQALQRDVRQVEFSCAKLGKVNADPHLLKVVMENLLGNAWKYSAKTESAHIEVGEQIQNGETVFFVKDNGVGFDMEQTDKIFGAFQRLHKQDEYEGMGIGLATVQRIIHRHGGRIWAEAEVGKGACFYFTLGKR